MGVVTYVPSDYWPHNTVLYATDFLGNDPRFACYFLQHFDLRRFNSGSAQASLNRNYIYPISIRVPELPEQQAIACILGALDDKIELNRRRNRTLEAMARAIFQSWFVDFDPVRTKADNGLPSGLSPDLAGLFPDSFEESALGSIPCGWPVGSIRDLVKLSREAIVPGDYPAEAFDHYSIPAFDAGQNPAQETGQEIKSQKFSVINDCVLVSKLNPKTPRVWLPDTNGQRRPIASTEFLVCWPHRDRGIGRAFFYCLSCDAKFSEYLTGRATGTSNSHQRVRPEDFLSYTLPIPSRKLAAAFEDHAKPLLDRTALVKRESRTLAALRDTLLPKLISGALRVPDAERIVGRAT